MGWVWGWEGVVFHINPVITLGTDGFFLACGGNFWWRPNSEDLHVGRCTILRLDRTGKRPWMKSLTPTQGY